MDAEQEPAQASSAKKGIQTAVGCLVLLALLGGVAAAIKSCGAMFTISPETKAIVAGQLDIEGRLKSPGSAKWVDRGTIHARSNDGRHLLLYYVVDSQNTLGAMLRSHWLVVTLHIGEGKDPQVLDIRGFEEAPRVLVGHEMMNEILERSEWVTEEEWQKSHGDS